MQTEVKPLHHGGKKRLFSFLLKFAGSFLPQNMSLIEMKPKKFVFFTNQNYDSTQLVLNDHGLI